jgi:hypothetical protein
MLSDVCSTLPFESPPITPSLTIFHENSSFSTGVNSETDWPRHDAGESANPKAEAHESQATTKQKEKTRDRKSTRLNRTMVKYLKIFVLFPRRYLNL